MKIITDILCCHSENKHEYRKYIFLHSCIMGRTYYTWIKLNVEIILFVMLYHSPLKNAMIQKWRRCGNLFFQCLYCPLILISVSF